MKSCEGRQTFRPNGRSVGRRDDIVAIAAPIFNRKGYAGTSIAAVLDATSLEKGGLYNHFASKEELAVASFDYAFDLVKRFFARRLDGVEDGAPYLFAYAEAFERYSAQPVIDGGCPLANVALEADDALPFLRDRVRRVIDSIRANLLKHAAIAVKCGDFRADVDAGTVADFMLATLEGTVVVARASSARRIPKRVFGALVQWLHSLESR